MSTERVRVSETNKNTRNIHEKCPISVPIPTGCANCAKSKSLSKDFVSFDIEPQVTLTCQEVLEKVFQVKFDPLSNPIQLCHNCGLELFNLYKCYEEFLQLCAIDSTLSKVIKINHNHNSSDISSIGSLKRSVNNRKVKCKKLYKNHRNEEKTLNSKLKKDSEDVSQNHTSGIGEYDNLNIGTSLLCWESFGPMDDSDDNFDDIKIEDIKPFLNDLNVQEAEIHSPSPAGCGIDSFGTTVGSSDEPVDSRTQTLIPTTSADNGSDEFDLTELLKPLEVGPSGKLKQPKTCRICNKTFTRSMEMRIHLTRIHFVECGVPVRSVFRKETPQDCAICGKTLISKGSLRAHLRFFHARQRNHSCTICKKAFPTANSVKVHLKTHTNPGQKTALCSVCGKGFTTKGGLKDHLKDISQTPPHYPPN